MSQFFESLPYLRAKKVLKSEFVAEAIIIFVKSIKNGIEWYIHFLRKPIIWFAIILPIQPPQQSVWNQIYMLHTKIKSFWCFNLPLLQGIVPQGMRTMPKHWGTMPEILKPKLRCLHLSFSDSSNKHSSILQYKSKVLTEVCCLSLCS